MLYLTYDEIYDRLFNEPVNEVGLREARTELAHMSDEEYGIWIEYKSARLRKPDMFE